MTKGLKAGTKIKCIGCGVELALTINGAKPICVKCENENKP